MTPGDPHRAAKSCRTHQRCQEQCRPLSRPHLAGRFPKHSRYRSNRVQQLIISATMLHGSSFDCVSESENCVNMAAEIRAVKASETS